MATQRLILAPDREAWERQPNETDKEFGHFKTYRDWLPLHDRSFAAVARKVKSSPATISNTAARCLWADRATAYDAYKDKQEREEAEKTRLEAVRKMQENHLALAQNMQLLAATELKKIMDRAKQHAKRTILTPQQVTKLIDAGTKLERLTRGEPTDNVANEVSINETSKQDRQRMLQKIAASKEAMEAAMALRKALAESE